MSSLQERFRCLEEHLRSRKPLSGYHDLPFGIFRYRPGEELAVRREIGLLAKRLQETGRRVVFLSLAQMMWNCLQESEDLETVFTAEADVGLDRVIETVNSLMERNQGFVQAIVSALSGLDPARDIGFLVDAWGLFPFFRSSAILSRLHGRVKAPTVLFYPGTLVGTVGLSFMGVHSPDPTYRPNILCEV